ncbi:MAG: DUF429 domain-containing protein [Xanthomonadales bacterium]|jgi:predicted RNase H-like nuclease|nr:DUF429 domain-containing protein [Xanthomonadales bacterium]
MKHRSKSQYVGVDGCPAGWFYVAIDENGDYTSGVEHQFRRLAESFEDARLILVDIPIGLPFSGQKSRFCDVAARKVISPRGSTIFPAPARSSLSKPTYEAACEENRRVLGKKLSVQSWAIAKKIQEVDQFMRNHSVPAPVREMHPEVAFWALNYERPLLESKKKIAGEEERLNVLSRFYPRAVECFEACKTRYPRKTVAKDDILDAMVGAVTAMKASSLASFPPNPSHDEAGLPMEIVYADLAAERPELPGMCAEEFEAKAAEVLGRYIFAFSGFEFNLALTLRSADLSSQIPFEMWEDTLTFKQKLDKFIDLLNDRFSSDAECKTEILAWHQAADAVRIKRNGIIHGRWGLDPRRQQIMTVAKGYPGADEYSVKTFTIAALERELDDISRLDRELWRIRKRWNLV